MRYYMESYYNYQPDEDGNIIDVASVGYATPEHEARDGENFVGSSDAYDMCVYDTLEEAILGTNYIANKIEFVELSEDDIKFAKGIVERLMKDEKYLKRFGRGLSDEN